MMTKPPLREAEIKCRGDPNLERENGVAGDGMGSATINQVKRDRSYSVGASCLS
jgi:hypothetical protein